VGAFCSVAKFILMFLIGKYFWSKNFIWL